MDPTNTKQKKENELFSIFPSYFHWCALQESVTIFRFMLFEMLTPVLGGI